MSAQGESGRGRAVDVIDSGLYPDVIEKGGLKLAIEHVAQAEGLDIGRIFSEYTSGAGLYNSATVDTGRGSASILLGKQRRLFSVEIYGSGFTWADGFTDDLLALTKALAAWKAGARLAEFSKEFPFMQLTRLAWAYDSGDPISAQWDWLLSEEMYAGERQLVAAAAGDGSLRKLFPYLSHGELCLTEEHGRRSARVLKIIPLRDGSYRVTDSATAGAERVAPSMQLAVVTASEMLTP